MMRYLLLMVLALFSGSCKQDKIIPAATCYPEIADLKRDGRVFDVPVTFQLSGGLISGGQLILSNGTAWSACNLPDEFKKDSLSISVSGYYLTSSELDLMNISPVPFEVTSASYR